MMKGLQGSDVSFILVAEDPEGQIVICQEFDDYEKSERAFKLVSAPRVCLYRQDCKTVIIECK